MDPSNPWMIAAVLVVLILAIAWGLWSMMRFRAEIREDSADAPAKEDLLGPIRAAYEAGQMSTAEYERIRASLGDDSLRSYLPRPRSKPVAEPEAPPKPPPPDPVTDPSSTASHPEPD